MRLQAASWREWVSCSQAKGALRHQPLPFLIALPQAVSSGLLLRRGKGQDHTGRQSLGHSGQGCPGQVFPTLCQESARDTRQHCRAWPRPAWGSGRLQSPARGLGLFTS